MSTDASLRLFAHIAARSEADLDLPRAALLLAEAERPGLDVVAYLERLDELGLLARERLAKLRPGQRVAALLDLFYEELGFSGNAEDYYDPGNSFLDQVLDRRTGIPITLAVVLVEVARRAGLHAHGVGFPGHFLVRFDDDDETTLVDPFEGLVLDDAGLAALAMRSTGRPKVPEAQAFEPATKANTLIRMLNNLRGIYAAEEDRPRLRGILERLEVLAPSADLRRQIEALGGGLTPPPRSRPTLIS
jgi:regulator of sirC expression with transglutaminase-like and TPR domain